ncbi:MAG: ATP-dependent DNA helicase RecG [Gammaproteobacteria bacterium]|nr:ATP-dependent DNA helicase RecG [Gammaproteobacteria bacterium]
MGGLKLRDSVTALRGVGPGSAKRLARLGIAEIRDLLLHLPLRYQDRTRTTPLGELAAGTECLVAGEILGADVNYGRRRSLLVRLQDDSGRLAMRLFHYSRGQRESFAPGAWVRCFGAVRMGPLGLEMVHPEYRLFPSEPPPPAPELTPVYRQTEGIATARLAGWIQAALADVDEEFGIPLPDQDFPLLLDALRCVHGRAMDDSDVEDATEERKARLAAARRRIVLDELLAHYLVMKRRRAARGGLTTTPLPPTRQLGRELLRNLGFRLTGAQARVARDVLNDLASNVPMMRLLQGDVGSGKTVIAAFAAIRAAEHGCQTALMAPTEILAEQHFETLSAWLGPLGIGVGLLTGRLAAAERRARLAAVEGGEDLVVVGTHALFQSGVAFQRLALAIVDEQHRFGVEQRMMLRHKGEVPHHLVMTATPIPRTLTMALYADMDVSVIDELPPGRQAVRTRVVTMSRRNDVIAHVGQAVAAGAQVYWVCTVIDGQEGEVGLAGQAEAAETTTTGEAPPSIAFRAAPRDPERAATTTFDELQEMLPDVRSALVHGRLPATEKATAMAAFKAGEIDLLVATTVIEVGVDVPNASLMVIDNAERLGLAQLHQLRGRVGRGSARSDCVLLYQPPLSEVATQRLAVLRKTNDGFVIAEKDLELRGPGDILGTRQTGEQAFRIADLAEDAALVPLATRIGDSLPDSPELAGQITSTWAFGTDADYAGM